MQRFLRWIDSRLVLIVSGVAVFAVACAPGGSGGAEEPDAVPTATIAATEAATATRAATPTVTSDAAAPADEELPAGVARSFSTDFSQHSIPFNEILSGGPPKDGIPAIDSPSFVSVSEADEWLNDVEPVTVLEHGGETRIYPYQILTWHEIVNDVIGDRPVAVTFCPLCNTAIAFDATVDGMALDFGTTGRLRYSNLLMYDRQTESWWQQATGEAVIGEFTGERLTFLPAATVSWAEAQDTYPDAPVLSRDTGHRRNYGQNPYTGYDNINSSPFLYDGPLPPGELPAMARVTTVELNGEAVAYPNEVLEEVVVVNDTVGGVDVVVFWQPGVASALDSSVISAGRDVGTSAVFERTLDDQTLTFVADGDTIQDEQTGSTWSVLGEAVDGELAGQQLQPVVKVDHFWFSWAAFRPETRIFQP
ncbi:MAG TPA: DUF3179 domain-containing protein [Candidatus Sulfomarinibacteraceae bacterium]|nr:DUF3179 domain-containing protein [Candidatus Sulfomarinibacteraceae bacterium]